MKLFKKGCLTLVLFLLAAFFLPMVPVHASDTSESEQAYGPNIAWIRAKLTYESEGDGFDGLGDEMITFSSDKWKKSGDWYYYKAPVEDGEKIRFIDGVRIPTEWTNDLDNKTFRIIVTVEVAEVAPGEEDWDENTKAAYAETFELWNNGYTHDEDIYVKEGKLDVRIDEYQLNANGEEVEYENDKIILPGQFVSKIVEITVGGERGALVKLRPEAPKKYVTVDGVNVDGKIVAAGTAVTYTIVVKNPSPEKSTITIKDVVDDRLVVTDTCGGTMTDGVPGSHGGTIEWTIDVEGNEEGYVNFIALTPSDIEEDEGMTIPNTGEATIVGKKLKTNTVIVSLGDVSPLSQIIARATGDPMRFALYCLLALLALLAAVVTTLAAMHYRKRRRA